MKFTLKNTIQERTVTMENEIMNLGSLEGASSRELADAIIKILDAKKARLDKNPPMPGNAIDWKGNPWDCT